MASLGANLRVRTTGIWRGGGHPAPPIVTPAKHRYQGAFNHLRTTYALTNHLRFPSVALGMCLMAGRGRCYSEHGAWTEKPSQSSCSDPRAHNSAVECHLHTVEVVGSNPAVPTIKSTTYRAKVAT